MWLTVRTGDQRGRTIRVEGDTFVVGRDDDCDLTLDDGKVSRRHAMLSKLADGSVSLRDYASSNGTYVNGERVSGAVLRGGEQVQFGDTVVTSSAEEPTARAAATLLGSAVMGSAAALQMLVRRSRRATVVASAAALMAVSVGALVATGVVASGGADAAVRRVVDEAAPATVLVEAVRRDGTSGSGSGFVVDANDGLVLTNAHVLNGGRRFRIGVSNGFRDATVVGVAPCEDLALLRVSKTAGLVQLPLGRQATVEQGETVVAVGYPTNAAAEATLTSTTGVVSIARTSYREVALDVPQYRDLIQVDAAINPGNSGGPLLDLDGRVIGLVAAVRTVAPDGRLIQGQGYAISVDRVREVLAVLRTGRSLGWAGLSFDYPSAARLRRERLPVGLVVADTVAGVSADAAGVARGRPVLVRVNGKRIANSLASYCDAVADVPSGDAVTVTLVDRRSGKTREVRVRTE